MAEDVSLAVRLSDQTSAGFAAIKKSAGELEKEFGILGTKAVQLSEKNQTLNKSYAAFEAQADAAKKKVKDAAKAFADAATDANKSTLDKAREEYKNLTDTLDNYKKASADTRKEIRNLQDEMRKMEDGGGSGAGGSGGGSGDALTGRNAALSGLLKQVGSAASGFASYYMSSAMSDADATMVSSILEGAVSGGSVGMLAGTGGAAIGAIVGGVSGLVSGITANAEKEDEVFTSYRDELVSAAEEQMAGNLSTGIGSAATREQDKISFSTLLGGTQAADEVLGGIKTLANSTPYLYDDLVSVAKQLSVYGYGAGEDKNILSTLTSIGDAGSAIGWSTADQATVAQQLGFLGESENASAQQLKQLLRKGLSVYDWLGESYGVSQGELTKMISGGEISGSDAASVILTAMGENFSGSMEQQSQTYTGLQSTIEGLTQEIQNSMGESYNAARIENMTSQVEWLSGDTAEAMSQAYSIIGDANAIKDNFSQKVYQDVMDGVLRGADATTADDDTVTEITRLRDEYLAAMDEWQSGDEQQQMDAGAKMQSILEQAEAMAVSSAETDDRMSQWNESQISLVHGVGRIIYTLDSYKDAWARSQAQSYGMQNYANQGGGVVTANGIISETEARKQGVNIYGRAMGQHVIPYNDFPITAHQGEMLLTASEARAYKQGRSGGVQVNINGPVTVRQDSDITAVAAEFARQLEMAERISV